MPENQLAGETSPYLLQHRENPVDWRPWNARVLAEAFALDKPILLSVGYAACHWCHVMARESFENPDIAALINELYVPVKVDREERPDLDLIYQLAVVLLGERGGWPLTVFLTPEGKPFRGGTYFPPSPRWGQPGFPEVLREVSGEYRNRRGEIASRAEGITERLNKAEAPADAHAVRIDEAFLDRMAQGALGSFDPLHGGLRNPPKFPNCPILEMLWRGYRRSGDIALRDAVLKTLTAMCQGGLYDHLGGGFSRYCVDHRWLVPHFEKMLYDNAQIIDLLVWAWQETGSGLWRRRIEETVEWALREMRVAEGAFATSLSAESGEEEGGYYLWTQEEIDERLGDEAPLFRQFYNVIPAGNWEGRTILHRLRQKGLADEGTEAALLAARRALFEVRAGRTPPACDDKVLADGNGLMIAALTEAARALERPDWLKAARTAWNFIVAEMRGSDHRLAHSWRQGRSHPGTLDDYAALCRAGLRLHEATGEPEYLAQVEAWSGVLDARFASSEGGYFLTDLETDNPLPRIRPARDGAIPSGNALLIGVLGRLHLLTGKEAYFEKAMAIISAFSGTLEEEYLPTAGTLNGIDFLLRPLQVAVIGEPASPEAREMAEIVFSFSLPNRVLVTAADAEGFPPDHPLHGKGRVEGRTTAYLCEGPTCSLPVTSPAALRERLREISGRRDRIGDDAE